VDAKFESRLRLVVATENVRRLSLGPCARKTPVDVVLDGFEFQNVLLWRRVVAFEQEGKEWRYATAGVPAVQKRPGASGPIGDAFFGPVRLVPGTTGSGHENFLIDWMAGAIPGYFKQKNGGVNRGIFDGETQHEIPVVSDRQLADAALGQCHLFLLGTYDSNQILARFRGQLPLEFGSRSIRIGERVYQGENLGVCACFPSPANPDRLVVVTGGVSPTAITGATHFNLQLLPDYLVWDGDQMLDFGFFGNDWR
jgi:hypothetical protein